VVNVNEKKNHYHYYYCSAGGFIGGEGGERNWQVVIQEVRYVIQKTDKVTTQEPKDGERDASA
jgi:hypothetical protein